MENDEEYNGYTIRTGGGVYLVLSITTDPKGNPDEYCEGQFPLTDDPEKRLGKVKEWIDILAADPPA